jgi:hypothetical protein
MPSLIRRIAAVSPFVVLGLNACLPYTVGSTARTVPAHETTRMTSWYYIPSAVKEPGDTIAVPLAGSDVEFRHGLDARSDLGVRILPGGVAADYKRRFDADASGTGTALAWSVGGGFVNGGEHMMVQATLIASGREDVTIAPYGGLRAIHVLPISEGAVSDRPTLGGFFGAQIGDGDFIVRPELGVYYDHSALGVRSRDVIFVPAITLKRATRGERLSREPRQNRPRPVVSPSRPADPRRTPAPIVVPRSGSSSG